MRSPRRAEVLARLKERRDGAAPGAWLKEMMQVPEISAAISEKDKDVLQVRRTLVNGWLTMGQSQ
jgi:hypothetical protein